MNEPLREYLRSVSKAGVYESTGHFTVDVQKRRMKLRENQFLDPTHSILCCVRAGVTSGADSIEIVLGVRSTSVFYTRPKQLLPKELLEAVLGASGAAETERLLGAAFQGAFANGCESIEIDIPGARVSMTPEDMDVEPTDDEELHCQITFHFGSDRVAGRERCVGERAALLAKAAFCPIPLLVNGTAVNEGAGWESLFHWQKAKGRYGVHPDFVWLEAMLLDVGEPFLAGASGKRFRLEYVDGERFSTEEWQPDADSAFLRIMPRLKQGKRRVGSLTRIGSSLEGQGYLYPLKQGVILEPIEENLGAPAVGIVARVDHLEVDLTLFQVKQDDRYERLVTALQQQTKALVYKLGRDRKAFALRRDGHLVKGLYSSLAWGGGVATLMVPTGIWGSLFGGLGAMCTAGLVHSLRYGDRAVTSREKRVWWELSQYVEAANVFGSDRVRL